MMRAIDGCKAAKKIAALLHKYRVQLYVNDYGPLVATIAEMRDIADVSISDADNDLLGCLAAAQRYFQKAGNFAITVGQYQYALGVTLPKCFYLPRFPLVEIISFKNADDDYTDYTIDQSSNRRAKITTAIDGPADKGNWEIVFTAGAEDVDPLLKRGILGLANHYYQNRGAVGNKQDQIPFGVDTILSLFRDHNG